MISVIVPVYNVEPYLRKCLDSIVNQTYRDLEILVIDVVHRFPTPMRLPLIWTIRGIKHDQKAFVADYTYKSDDEQRKEGELSPKKSYFRRDWRKCHDYR